MEAGKKAYFPEIDLCRGIGILLVVLGHALKQTGETNTVFQVLLSVIYSFHMPLFFVLSGFVSAKVLSIHTWQDRKVYIGNRAYRLLIPYFVVGILYTPVKILLSRYAVKPFALSSMWRMLLGENPDVALWFVYILFWISVLCAFLLTEKTLTTWLGISFLCAVLAYACDLSLRLPKYWFFFVLGLYVRVHYREIREEEKGSDRPEPKRRNRILWFVAALVVFILANLVLYSKNWTVLQMVTSLSGIVLSLQLSVWLSESNRDNRMLHVLGSYSMDIYILSEPLNTVTKLLFWNILHANYVVCTVMCFVAGIALPVPISKYIVRRVKLFRTAILGMK